mmetsp:Transcript_69980/g.221729  ORF Transcript_69980/g.221729 Transcript_69980/m.221729 type:complete len:211 (+) Transcript_69980:719-1351(+)
MHARHAVLRGCVVVDRLGHAVVGVAHAEGAAREDVVASPAAHGELAEPVDNIPLRRAVNNLGLVDHTVPLGAEVVVVVEVVDVLGFSVLQDGFGEVLGRGPAVGIPAPGDVVHLLGSVGDEPLPAILVRLLARLNLVAEALEVLLRHEEFVPRGRLHLFRLLVLGGLGVEVVGEVDLKGRYAGQGGEREPHPPATEARGGRREGLHESNE